MEQTVWWVIDDETDRIVGSRHSEREAEEVLVERDASHHHAHLCVVTMTVAETRTD